MEIVKAELGGELVNSAQKDFVSGLQSLGKVVAILKETEVNDSTPVAEVMKTAKKLPLPIRQAHGYLTKSLGLWEHANDRLSELIERKVRDIGSMKTDISEKVVCVEMLKKTLESLSEQIESNEKQLDEAKSSLNRASKRLKEQRDELEKRERDQAIVAGIGIGITPIPIVGWIAGPTMVSLTAREDAIKASRDKVDSAKEHFRSCERLSDVLSYKKKIRDDLQQELALENAERQETEKKLEVLKAKVQTLLDVQEKLRNTCHFVTKISRKSNVLLEMVTTNAYSLEPLFAPLKEIAIMFDCKEHNKLKVTTLLFNDTCMDFTGLSLKLKAICEKTQDEVLNTLESLFTLVKENTRMFTLAILEHNKLTTLLFKDMNFTVLS